MAVPRFMWIADQQAHHADRPDEFFFRLFRSSFLSAAPSRGLSSSNEHSSSESTPITEPKLSNSAWACV